MKNKNKEQWSLDQKILPYADISGNLVTIHDIRNFTYTTETEYTPSYYDKTFDLKQIKSLDFVVEPFSKTLAHTFFTFGFENGSHVCISVEVRKKPGQSYSVLKSLIKPYGLMYVVADENDMIKLRTNYRHDSVYLYPIKAHPDQIRKIFLSMLHRVNKLKDKPELYSLFNNNCTVNLAKHVNEMFPGEIPFSYKEFLTKHSDELVYDLGLIDTDLSLKDARKKFLINEKAEKCPDNVDFSSKIREF